MSLLSNLDPRGEKPKKPPVHEPTPGEIREAQETSQAGQKIAEFQKLEEQIAASSPTQAALFQAKKAADDKKAIEAKKREIDAGIQQEKTAPETVDVPVRDENWVNRAEKIIDADREHPYQEENDEAALQEEFLNNQYHEGIGLDEDKK